MPTKAVYVGSVTSAEIIVSQDNNRTVLLIQIIDAVNYVDISDGITAAQGTRLFPGGVLTLRKVRGEQPEKQYVGNVSASLWLRILEQYGEVQTTPIYTPIPNPQNPQAPTSKDAPEM